MVDNGMSRENQHVPAPMHIFVSNRSVLVWNPLVFVTLKSIGPNKLDHSLDSIREHVDGISLCG